LENSAAACKLLVLKIQWAPILPWPRSFEVISYFLPRLIQVSDQYWGCEHQPVNHASSSTTLYGHPWPRLFVILHLVERLLGASVLDHYWKIFWNFVSWFVTFSHVWGSNNAGQIKLSELTIVGEPDVPMDNHSNHPELWEYPCSSPVLLMLVYIPEKGLVQQVKSLSEVRFLGK
jgi:hypothetical protein